MGKCKILGRWLQYLILILCFPKTLLLQLCLCFFPILCCSYMWLQHRCIQTAHHHQIRAIPASNNHYRTIRWNPKINNQHLKVATFLFIGKLDVIGMYSCLKGLREMTSNLCIENNRSLCLLLDVLIAVMAQVMHQLQISASWTFRNVFQILQSLVGCSHTLLRVRGLLLWYCPQESSKPFRKLDSCCSENAVIETVYKREQTEASRRCRLCYWCVEQGGRHRVQSV